ncbi:MAG: PAS domain S-box protein [Chloroflexi bacterium]|nr:PAS domain S-box protein [Chloroflexota bacterium]
MWAGLGRWLSLPTWQNEEDRQIARILLRIMLAAVTAFFLVIVIGLYVRHSAVVITCIIGGVLLIAPVNLLRRGHLRASGIVLALDTLGVVTFSALAGKGIHDVAIIAYPIIVLFAALALGKRSFVIFVFLTNGSIGGVAWAMFLSAPDVTTLAEAITAMMAITVAAFIAHLLAENMRQNLAHAQRQVAERQRIEVALRESEKRYRLLAENISDVIWILDLDAARFRYVSPSVERLRGYTAEEVLAQDMAAALTPQSLAYLQQALPGWRHAFQQGQTHIDGYAELEQPCKHGGTVWTEAKARFVVNPDNGHLEVYGLSRDISARKQIEDQLRQLSRAIEQSPVSIVITDTVGDIEYVNPKFTHVTGYTFEEVRGKNPRILKSGEMPPQAYKELWETVFTGKEWRGEFHNKKKNGELYWESASISPITDMAGKITHFVAVKEDITARKRDEEQLRFLSTHDTLTGLYNRTFFEAEAARLEQSRAVPISVIIADVDRMKETNDTLGHHAGDELLRHIAQALQSALRTSDIIARIGGDEFAILLPETDARTADQVLERIKTKLGESQTRRTDLVLSLSLGVATAEGGQLEETFRLADQGMYTDKRAHKRNGG